jgi:hypothetical protein
MKKDEIREVYYKRYNPKPKGKTGRGGGQYGNKNAEKWTEEKALKLGNEILKWVSQDPIIRSTDQGKLSIVSANLFISKYLIQHNYCHTLTSELAKKYKSFATVLLKIKKLQEIKINSLGLFKLLDPGLVKFNLINHYGYKDKTQTDLTSNGEKLEMPIINVTPYKKIDDSTSN